jgi:hypothetical protein
MRLFELFSDDAGEGDMISTLRQDAIDMLMPLAAQKVPYVSVQAIIDKLRTYATGITIDRALVMQILDPNAVKLITKIEGDKVYFTLPENNEREVDDTQKKKDAEHTQSTAQDQAKKVVTQSDSPLA